MGTVLSMVLIGCLVFLFGKFGAMRWKDRHEFLPNVRSPLVQRKDAVEDQPGWVGYASHIHPPRRDDED